MSAESSVSTAGLSSAAAASATAIGRILKDAPDNLQLWFVDSTVSLASFRKQWTQLASQLGDAGVLILHQMLGTDQWVGMLEDPIEPLTRGKLRVLIEAGFPIFPPLLALCRMETVEDDHMDAFMETLDVLLTCGSKLLPSRWNKAIKIITQHQDEDSVLASYMRHKEPCLICNKIRVNGPGSGWVGK